MATPIPAATMRPATETGKCFCLYLFFLLTLTFSFFNSLTFVFTLLNLFYLIFSIESDANFNIDTKGSKINCIRSPHCDKTAKIISDWTNKEGETLDVKVNPLTPKAMFASKVGIPWK